MEPIAGQQVDVLNPLAGYYAAVRATMPGARIVSPPEIPQPQRRLLVHDDDMTPTLERFHGQAVLLRVLGKRIEGGTLQRTVCLVGTVDDRPVEFGAIGIHLDAFDPDAQVRIHECRVPLGTILHEHAITHRSRPSAFFTVESDAVIGAALGIGTPSEADAGPPVLYGRRNELTDPTGRRLAEVVEILPPPPSSAPGQEGHQEQREAP